MAVIQVILFFSLAFAVHSDKVVSDSWEPVFFLDVITRVFSGEDQRLLSVAQLESALFKNQSVPQREPDFQQVVSILNDGISSARDHPMESGEDNTFFSKEGLPLVLNVNKTFFIGLGPKKPQSIVLGMEYSVWSSKPSLSEARR